MVLTSLHYTQNVYWFYKSYVVEASDLFDESHITTSNRTIIININITKKVLLIHSVDNEINYDIGYDRSQYL